LRGSIFETGLIQLMRCGIQLGITLLLAAVSSQQLLAQDDPSATARRIADVTAIALDEYVVGVIGGRVVSEDELREARLFIEEARRAADQLPADARDAALPFLNELAAGVTALRPLPDLRRQLTGLRESLEQTLSVILDPMPTGPPSLVRGEELYAESCQQCHGPAGAGDGTLAASLDPPPADLTDTAALRSSSPVDFFRKLNVGVAGTAMPGFNEQFGLDDRWALALYSSLLRYTPEQLNEGAAELSRLCDDCDLVVSDFELTALLSDDSLATLVAARMNRSREQASMSTVAYARAAGAIERLGGNGALAAARVVARAKQEVASVMEVARSGEGQAAATGVLDAYIVFEEIETSVRARNGRAATRVEQAFTQLRGALLSGGAWADVVEAHLEVDESLDGALAILNQTSSPTSLFGQSFVIMLREGLEAILIIGALMAFLVKAGAPERKSDVGWGVVAALAASALTAVGFSTMFRSARQHQEAIEGITMLVAAAVLFWVSYWLVSKIELRKWQDFVRSKMQNALRSERAFALSAVGFLAVYREGFETVLFYAALFTTSDGSVGASTGIVSGILVGLAILGVVYFLMQRYSLHLPLKPFFGVTSALLYVMAFSFAGQGVAELQEGGIISVTPLSWMPSVPVLGIFPTTQTLFSQLLIATALLGALLWVFWIGPRVVRVSSER
jgi:high-affinity iron transporter